MFDMKRYLIYLLVIAVFYAPLAWAWDAHDSAFEGHTNMTLEHTINVDGDQDDHYVDQNDHCDHGIAHLTTLLTSEITFSHTKSAQENLYWRDSFTVLALVPPYRPPIL